VKTPGRAAHDTWCADDDWHLLDDEERALWEAAGQAAADVAEPKLAEIRLVLDAFDWETDDRQYALEQIDEIVNRAPEVTP
jgi:hypothetical protein